MLDKLRKCIIITTINNAVNNALKKFSTLPDLDLIIVGDTKSPKNYDINCEFLSVIKQKKLFPKFNKHIPYCHYSRKNFGYLYSIMEGYDIIMESDDDNYPYDNWPLIPPLRPYDTISYPKYPNVYSYFSNSHIWPRGFPLDQINNYQNIKISKKESNILVWQGLVDGDPDVDAIHRLIFNNSIIFEKNKIVTLEKGVISPFNSQNTIWQKEAFHLLYLPFSVNFRFTDILRSFVAQFGLWPLQGRLGFTSATATQKRNPHNLMHDFFDEFQMHESFYKTIECLESCYLRGEPEDLIIMYSSLVKAGIVSKKELLAVKSWVEYLKQL